MMEEQFKENPITEKHHTAYIWSIVAIFLFIIISIGGYLIIERGIFISKEGQISEKSNDIDLSASEGMIHDTIVQNSDPSKADYTINVKFTSGTIVRSKGKEFTGKIETPRYLNNAEMEIVSGKSTTGTVIVSLGNKDAHMTFEDKSGDKKEVEVTVQLGTHYALGSGVDIRYSENGKTWQKFTTTKVMVLENNVKGIKFTTDHFSLYKISGGYTTLSTTTVCGTVNVGFANYLPGASNRWEASVGLPGGYGSDKDYSININYTAIGLDSYNYGQRIYQNITVYLRVGETYSQVSEDYANIRNDYTEERGILDRTINNIDPVGQWYANGPTLCRDIISDTTPPPVPTMVSEPECTAGTSNTVSSTQVVDDGGGIVYYEFCSSTTNTPTGCTSVGRSTSNYTIFNGLSNRRGYYYFVRAKDSYGNTSNRSASVTSMQDTNVPNISEVTPVPSIGNDNTPNYTLQLNELKSTLTYAGGCIGNVTIPTAFTQTVTFSPLADGTYASCTITVTDCAGTVGNTLTVSPFIIDTAAPIAQSIRINGGAQYTTNPTTTLTLSGTDNIGVTQMKFSCDNNTWSPSYAYNTTMPRNIINGSGCNGTDEVNKYVYVKFGDAAGNRSTVGPSYNHDQWSITYDTTAPSTTITPNGATCAGSDQSATLSCTDATAGCTSSEYKIVASAATCNATSLSTYVSAFTVPGSAGAYTQSKICYRSTDKAGNSESIKPSNIYNIDKAPPTNTTLSAPSNGSSVSTLTPILTRNTVASDIGCSSVLYDRQLCSDAACNTVLQSGSSITSTSALLSTLTNGSTYYRRARSKDAFGNTNGRTSTYSFTVSTTVTTPTCTASVGAFCSSQSVTCSSSLPIKYTIDGTTPTCSSAAWSNQSFSNSTTLKVISCDNGVASAANMYTYAKDTVGPAITAIPGSVQETNPCNVTISSIVDAGIGGTVYYSCDQANIPYAVRSSSTTCGYGIANEPQIVNSYVWGKDACGNVTAQLLTPYCTRTNLAPVANNISASANNGVNLTLTADATDPGAGGTPFTYQWYTNNSCTTPIAGATGSTYTTGSSQTCPTSVVYGYKVTDYQGSGSNCASATATWFNTTPSVSGNSTTGSEGSTLMIIGNASDTCGLISYQRYSDTTCTTPILGATGGRYMAPAQSEPIVIGYGFKAYDGTTGSSCTVSTGTWTNLPPNQPTLVSPPNGTWTTNRQFCATVSDPGGGNVSSRFVIGGTTYVGSTVASNSNSCYTYGSDLCSATSRYAYAVDNNSATSANTTSWSGKIDTAIPTTSITSPTAGTTQTPPFSVSFSDTDSCSSVNTCWYYVYSGSTKTLTGTQRTCNAPVTITGANCGVAGTNNCTVYGYSIDNAGNVSSIDSRAYSITYDTTPPAIGPATISVGNVTGYCYKGTISLQATGTDASLPLTCEYTTGANWAAATYSVGYCSIASLSPGTNITANFRARDTYNNLGTGTSTVYTYDATGPTPNVFLMNGGAASTNNATVTLSSLGGSDGCAGVAQMQFSCDTINRTAAESYNTTKSFNITGQAGAGCSLGDGVKTVYVRFIDKLGNTGTSTSKSITLDTTAPTFTFANNSGPECVTGTLSITSPSDVGVGYSSATGYSFDGSTWGSTTGISIYSGGIGTATRVGYMRDYLLNIRSISATYTFTDAFPTANDFTFGTNIGNTGRIADRLSLSNATEGSCGTSSLVLSGIVTNGTKGTCIQVGATGIRYTPNANKTGSDQCTIQIKDNENNPKNITITWTGIYTVPVTWPIFTNFLLGVTNPVVGSPILASRGSGVHNFVNMRKMDTGSILSKGNIYINGSLQLIGGSASCIPQSRGEIRFISSGGFTTGFYGCTNTGAGRFRDPLNKKLK